MHAADKRSGSCVSITSTSGTGHAGGSHSNNFVEIQALQRQLEDKTKQLRASEKERVRLLSENEKLKFQLSSSKRQPQSKDIARLEHELRVLKTVEVDIKTQLKNAQNDLLRSQGDLKDRDARISDMKKEYNVIFGALQKAKQSQDQQAENQMRKQAHRKASLITIPRTPSVGSLVSLSSVIEGHSPMKDSTREHMIAGSFEENPFVVNEYKARILELEQTVDLLHLRIRKMIATESKFKRTKDQLHVERSQLMERCGKLEHALDTSVRSNAQSLAVHERRLSIHLGEKHESKVKGNEDYKALKRNKMGSTTEDELKKLRQRNNFLEERFRSTDSASSLLVSKPVLLHQRGSLANTNDEEAVKGLEDIQNNGIAAINQQEERYSPNLQDYEADSEVNAKLDKSTLQSLSQVKQSHRIKSKVGYY